MGILHLNFTVSFLETNKRFKFDLNTGKFKDHLAILLALLCVYESVYSSAPPAGGAQGC